MTTMTRKLNAEKVWAHLVMVGPLTVEEIQRALSLTKREAEDALYLLGGRGEVEYTYPVTSPLTYKARA